MMIASLNRVINGIFVSRIDDHKNTTKLSVCIKSIKSEGYVIAINILGGQLLTFRILCWAASRRVGTDVRREGVTVD